MFSDQSGPVQNRILSSYGICRWTMFQSENYTGSLPMDLYELPDISSEGQKKSLDNTTDPERVREWETFEKQANRVRRKLKRSRKRKQS